MPPFELRERAFNFACAIVRFYFYLLDETRTPAKLADQLLRSGTSPSASLEEAEAAHSHPDFIVKISTALKEMREAHHWLRLLQACDLASADRITPLLAEAHQLANIFGSIRINAGHRRNERKPRPRV